MPRIQNITRSAAAFATMAVIFISTASTAGADSGYATWYGPGFHGNRMANGDIFDENDPTTTASNQYPFGTWLKVTNPVNGRSVTVQVRDRGGFSHALDLSKAAFFALSPPNSWGFTVEYQVLSGQDSIAPVAPTQSSAPVSAASAAASSTPIVPPVAKPSARPAAPKEHIVEPGQTLRAIAAMYDASVDNLIALNAIEDPDLVRIGQRLRLYSPHRAYAVKAGDTVYAIARQFGVAPLSIVELNRMDAPDSLSIGQEISIPS